MDGACIKYKINKESQIKLIYRFSFLALDMSPLTPWVEIMYCSAPGVELLTSEL
jgi:hypothetical protein